MSDPTDRPARPIGPERDDALFLAQPVYQRRRLGDAARVLPVLALVLMLVPLLWAPGAVRSSSAAIYLFGLWGALAVVAGLLSRRLLRPPAPRVRPKES
ncbi:MAG: hypothetical protein ACU0CO_17265 [Shimia sp.]